MVLPCFLVGILPDGTDPNCFAEDWAYGLGLVPLIGHRIFDAAVPVLSVVPADKATYPGFHKAQISESPE